MPLTNPNGASTKQKNATRIVARTGAITWSEPGSVQKLGSDERGAKKNGFACPKPQRQNKTCQVPAPWLISTNVSLHVPNYGVRFNPQDIEFK